MKSIPSYVLTVLVVSAFVFSASLIGQESTPDPDSRELLMQFYEEKLKLESFYSSEHPTMKHLAARIAELSGEPPEVDVAKADDVELRRCQPGDRDAHAGQCCRRCQQG